MKLPEDSHIAIEKLTRYLLVRQMRGDKSAFLALGGYTMSNARRLCRDPPRVLLHFGDGLRELDAAGLAAAAFR